MIKLAEVTNWVVQKNGAVGEKKQLKYIFFLTLGSVYKQSIVFGLPHSTHRGEVVIHAVG